jgi:tripartite-type tricarboxylate transporter receptor subunit TctC
VAELVARAKAAPGRIDYASSGPGTPYHIAGEVFRAMAGIEINHIPFRGSNEARTALIAGQVPVMFDAIPTMREQIVGGRVRGLATTGPERSALLPDLPSLAEVVPGYEASIWLGLMAPAGTPRPVLDKLNAEVIKVINAPDVKENWSKQGAVPMGMPVDEFGKFLREDVQKWAKLVKDTGMKVD